MQLHKMKRLEVIIERMAMARAGTILDQNGLTGYTVVSALAGSGGNHTWQRDTDLSRARDMVVMISIGDGPKVDAALKDLHILLDDHIGVLSVGEIEVMRPDRF